MMRKGDDVMASYVEEQYIQALEKENAELKRQLEKRRGLFEITCNLTKQKHRFYICEEDCPEPDSNPLKKSFMECGYYLARKVL